MRPCISCDVFCWYQKSGYRSAVLVIRMQPDPEILVENIKSQAPNHQIWRGDLSSRNKIHEKVPLMREEF